MVKEDITRTSGSYKRRTKVVKRRMRRIDRRLCIKVGCGIEEEGMSERGSDRIRMRNERGG